jgi:hypothetical protein
MWDMSSCSYVIQMHTSQTLDYGFVFSVQFF